MLGIGLEAVGVNLDDHPRRRLTVEVAARLSRLAERGYSTDQAGHAIGSGSLLIRTDDGAFGFIHQSIMEWLVASAAADALGDDGPPIKSVRRMSRLMVDFFVDLAGHGVARAWAIGVLADQNSSEISRQNALAVQQRLPATGLAPESRQMLAGVDLRDQELTGLDLRGADLRGVILRGMRLENLDFTGADLSDADCQDVRLVRGSLREAIVTGGRWERAALLGVDGVADLLTWPELRAAAVDGIDAAEPMIQTGAQVNDVAYSPHETLLAVARNSFVELVDATDGRTLRMLRVTPARSTRWPCPPTAPAWPPPRRRDGAALGPDHRADHRHPHRPHRRGERGGLVPRRHPPGHRQPTTRRCGSGTRPPGRPPPPSPATPAR